MKKIITILLCCSLLSCFPYTQSDKDMQLVTVTAYLDCYNTNTGWFMLIDKNGETWAFEDTDTADFRFDMPFTITYCNDFSLVSLQNNGQTVTFEVQSAFVFTILKGQVFLK